MSKAERMPLEYYPTPGWAIRRLVEAWDLDAILDLDWFDPCYGDGAFQRYFPVKRWTISDIVTRPIRGVNFDHINHQWEGDFLQMKPPPKAKVCSFNQPFSLTQEFIQHACAHYDYVISLVRMSFWGSKERNEWFREQGGMPKQIYVIPDRMKNITASGKVGQDNIGRCWAIYGRDVEPRPMVMLKCTPKKERLRDFEYALETIQLLQRNGIS